MSNGSIGVVLGALVLGISVFAVIWYVRSQMVVMERRWPEAFKAISFDLMQKSQEAWGYQTKETLESTITPLKQTLERYETIMGQLENTRTTAYAELRTEIKQLVVAKQELQQETSSLASALRTPQIGGSWGELTLRRVTELAGMVPYCDFDEQVSVSGEEGRYRPDMVVHLPGGRDLVVDAKVSLEHYLIASGSRDEEGKKNALKKHAALMREHLKKLAAKTYWTQFQFSPEFVVMFIPGESFLSAALEQDRTLLEDGMEKGVILATPTTLVALLRAVAYGWRQDEMAKNAALVTELGKELYDRMMTWMGHLKMVGESLEKAVKGYNSAVGSLESRVIPTARKFGGLGMDGGNEIQSFDRVDQAVRKIEIEIPEEGSIDGLRTS